MNNKNRTLIFVTPVAVTVGGTLLWRWISTRQERPCPSWSSILLENPYMNAVAGTKATLDRLDLSPGMNVLDVGCGPGRLTIPAALRIGPSGAVTALDLQPEMLQRAQERAVANNCDNIRFINGGIGDGLLPSSTFDRALLVTVIGEVLHKETALAEIFASLKPEGILSITEALPDPHYQTYRYVRDLALSAGFMTADRWRNGLAYTTHFIKPANTDTAAERLETITPG